MKKIVIALGGNALLQRGETQTADNQLKNIRRTIDALSEIAKEHTLIIVHGNGPQVGLLALQNAAYEDKVPSYPFDVLGAETQGMIGYMLQRELKSKLPNKNVSTLLTQIAVKTDDPAFDNPTKYIGPVYDEAVAKDLAKKNNWQVKADGDKWRRVVASPKPLEIVEISSIKTLIENNHTVICCGGGGIPVAKDNNGELTGIEAVIDKDFAASLLAREIGADHFVVLTDVTNVFDNFNTPEQVAITELTIAQTQERNDSKGSMGPKIDACVNFTSATKIASHIGSLTELSEILKGNKGTKIVV